MRLRYSAGRLFVTINNERFSRFATSARCEAEPGLSAAWTRRLNGSRATVLDSLSDTEAAEDAV
jgi:hypothetical protein